MTDQPVMLITGASSRGWPRDNPGLQPAHVDVNEILVRPTPKVE